MRSFTNAIDRFCRKHPSFGIPNLMLYVVIGSVIVFVLDLVSNSTCSAMLMFSRSAILHGEVWRLISFIFVPENSNFIYTALFLYLYYFIGTTLEREWGSAKFTCFYLTGILVNIVFGMIAGYSGIYYLNMSMFFCFATLFPDLRFLLFFIIPVKAKWLAWLDVAFFIIEIIITPFPSNLIPLVAIVNYLLFFGEDFFDAVARLFGKQTKHRKSPKPISFKQESKRIKEERGYFHKCTVCGRTDTDYPDLEFRYCSKCKGYYCYCIDHINNHVHITDE